MKGKSLRVKFPWGVNAPNKLSVLRNGLQRCLVFINWWSRFTLEIIVLLYWFCYHYYVLSSIECRTMISGMFELRLRVWEDDDYIHVQVRVTEAALQVTRNFFEACLPQCECQNPGCQCMCPCLCQCKPLWLTFQAI